MSPKLHKRVSTETSATIHFQKTSIFFPVVFISLLTSLWITSDWFTSIQIRLFRLNFSRNFRQKTDFNFTLTLPRIVINFFLNNQPDALIIPILFCYKTLHVSGKLSAHHQEFSTVHSALVSFMQV